MGLVPAETPTPVPSAGAIDVVTRTGKRFPCGVWAIPSPNGRLLAYVGPGEGVYVRRSNCGSPREVTPAPISYGTARPVRQISWAPNSRRLAFDVVGDDVYVVGTDGRGLRRLSTGRSPSWSSNGTRLAIEARIDLRGDAHAVAVLDPSAVDLKLRLVASGGDVIFGSVGFSRRGDELAFEEVVQNRSWIVVTTGKQLKARRRIGGRDPAWAPDGRQLAIARAGGVFLAQPGRSRLRRVASCDGLLVVSCRAPRWSPDGKRLAWLTGGGALDELRVTDRLLRRPHLVVYGKEIEDRFAWWRDNRTIFLSAIAIWPRARV
jgi:Tol biopolymer transport system component